MDNYFQAAANTQICGRAIAYLLNQLKQKGLNVSYHCVGHSLGGQVCGYAGKYSQSEFGWKFNRISGLDPAGPNFETIEDNQPLDVAVRIDKSGLSRYPYDVIAPSYDVMTSLVWNYFTSYILRC